MKEQFVTYEIAKKLKELGFNEPTFATFCPINEGEIKEGSLLPFKGMFLPTGNSIILAPLWQQAIDWLREKHKIGIQISPFPVYKDKYGIKVERKASLSGWEIPMESPYSYEQAREVAILKALELITK